MKYFGGLLLVLFAVSFSCALSGAQTPTEQATIVPRLLNYSGRVLDAEGKTVSGVAGVTFAIYKDQYPGTAPLWLETQNVTADGDGNYTAQLGATKPQGLPPDLFGTGEARWLGVQVSGQAEAPRVLLVAVPYALKAADAETVGGLPPSAFVLAATPTTIVPPTGNDATASGPVSGGAGAPPATTSDVTTTGGAVNAVPLFTTTKNIQNSILTQTGTAAINVAGKLNLPALGAATASGGKNSRPETMVASAFNSGTSTAVPETFQLQAEAAGNNTSAASGTLNLLYASGSATPAETGLTINNKGLITFASGQTFPGTGTGNGSVTSVGLSAPTSDFTVSGSPVTGTGTLALNWTVAPTSAATNNAIVKRDANGNFAGNNITASGLTATDEELGDQLVITTSNAQAFVAQTFDPDGGYAVTGFAANPGPSVGVYGLINSGDVGAFGVFGTTSSSSSTGVFGQQTFEDGSTTGNGHGYSAGVWGDSRTGVGVLGTADNSNAIVGINNSPTGYTTAFFENETTDSTAFVLYTNSTSLGGHCSVDVKGNLACSGTKSAVVPLDGGERKVALSAIEAPQNWFEDAGSAELISGSALVSLDPDFIQTVNTTKEYQVFLTPYGDCKGLYVTNRTASSFEVYELGGGQASVSFGYRILALRRNYENVRFADHTNDPAPYKAPPAVATKAPAGPHLPPHLPPRPAHNTPIVPTIAK